MIYLGKFKATDSVFYAANFHTDAGTLADPTGPEAQHRAPNGTWTALTAPAKQNAKLGHFGGTIDTTGFAAGQHIIRMAGTVDTAKTVATEFSFIIIGNTEAEIYGRLGAPAGASVSADIAVVKTTADSILTDSLTHPTLTQMEGSAVLAKEATSLVIKTKTDNLPTGIKKNTLLNNFEFAMVDSNGDPKTGLTVTSTRSIDGGVFGACVNSASEVGSGVYKIDIAAADLNGDIITLRCTAPGAKDRLLTIKTEA